MISPVTSICFLAKRPRLALANLGRQLVDIRICDSEFQNFFRFQKGTAVHVWRSYIIKLCGSPNFAAVSLFTPWPAAPFRTWPGDFRGDKPPP